MRVSKYARRVARRRYTSYLASASMAALCAANCSSSTTRAASASAAYFSAANRSSSAMRNQA